VLLSIKFLSRAEVELKMTVCKDLNDTNSTDAITKGVA
jgi:hypothetical protein